MCYDFVGWGELLTPPWMQVWGTIFGAALGAWFAVRGAARLARAQEYRAAENLAKAMHPLVGLMLAAARDLQAAWREPDGRTAAIDNMSLLANYSRMLDRFYPFTAIASSERILQLTYLSLAAGQIRDHLEYIDRAERTAGMQLNLRAVPRLDNHIGNVLDAATKAADALGMN